MKSLGLVVALVAGACSPPGSAPRWKAAGESEPRPGGTLRVSIRDTVATLDPAHAYDELTYVALRWLVEPLLDYAPGSTALVPRLAERWEASDGATTYRFWLRASRFSDGTAVTSADVKFALERARTEPDSPFASFVAGVTAIETPHDTELVIRLAQPDPAFAYVMAMPFTAPQRAAHVAAAGDQLRRQPLGNGPYLLAAWDEGQRLVFARNPHYRGTQPAYVERVVLLEGIPRDTQFLMFEQGALDSAANLAAPDLVWLRQQPAWQPHVRSTATLNAYGARFDVTQKPFDDVRVRRAFNHAIDRSHVTKLLAGTAVPAHGILPPGSPGYADLAPYTHDPRKARALLAEAGYAGGLALDFVTIADEDAEKLAASYQADLADVGVTLHINVVSPALYMTMMSARGGPALLYAGWQGDSPDPTNFLDAKFHSRGIGAETSANDAHYANPALDAGLDAARADTDPVRRAARYREAEKILAEDPPWLWVYHQAQTEVSQPYVQGTIPHPVWVRDFSTVWLDLGPDGERDEADR